MLAKTEYRPCEADLRAMHARGDYQALWLAALPLVKWTVKDRCVRKMFRAADRLNRRELIEEGELIAGEVVRGWDPDAGAFSTWIVNCVTARLKNYLRDKKVDVFGSMHWKEKVDVEKLWDKRESAKDEAIEMLEFLDPTERELVSRSFGVGCVKEGQAALAARFGLSQQTISRMLAAAFAKMADRAG